MRPWPLNLSFSHPLVSLIEADRACSSARLLASYLTPHVQAVINEAAERTNWDNLSVEKRA